MQKLSFFLLSLFFLFFIPLEAQKTIGIFTVKVEGTAPWDTNSPQKGITGSEEAVIYISQKLADLGFQVTVFGNPPENSPDSRPEANPRFVPINFKIESALDIAIAWRTPLIGKQLREVAYKTYFWPHDVCCFKLTKDEINCFDDVLWLSKWQQEEWSFAYPEFAKFTKIFGNGINPEQFELIQERTNPYSCIYGSNYGRGLDQLLDIWPLVKKQFPRATLDIYYGWQHWGNLSPEKEAKMRAQVQSLEPLGVKEHGLVSHSELTKAFQKASFWTYPCTAPETFCITALRAQLAGAVPVIIHQTALKETAPNGFYCSSPQEYLNTLTQAMLAAEKITLDARKNMGEFITKEYTWEKIAIKWKELFDAPIEKQSPSKKTICLNMVIKNENTFSLKSLASIKNLLDYWVIIDESDSNKLEPLILEYMKEIPGEFHKKIQEDPINSRNIALILSKEKADYVMLVDPMEELFFSEDFKLPSLIQDCYYLFSNSQKEFLINNHLPWKWTHVLSDQLFCLEAKNFILLPGVGISEGSQTPLTSAQSLFRLAQSYFEANEYESAFKNYEKIISLKESNFPLYPAFYSIGVVSEILNKPSEKIIDSYSQAYQNDSSRAEPLFRLSVHHFLKQNYILGYSLAKLALSIQNPHDSFCNDDWIYDYGILFTLGNCAFGLTKYEEAEKSYEMALSKPNIPLEAANEIRENLTKTKKLLKRK